MCFGLSVIFYRHSYGGSEKKIHYLQRGVVVSMVGIFKASGRTLEKGREIQPMRINMFNISIFRNIGFYCSSSSMTHEGIILKADNLGYKLQIGLVLGTCGSFCDLSPRTYANSI